jgi:hypothetical protein
MLEAVKVTMKTIEMIGEKVNVDINPNVLDKDIVGEDLYFLLVTDQDTIDGDPMHALMRESVFKSAFDFVGPENEDELSYVMRKQPVDIKELPDEDTKPV